MDERCKVHIEDGEQERRHEYRVMCRLPLEANIVHILVANILSFLAHKSP